MLPPRFGIKLIADSGIEKQFKVIESLFNEADEIINCGDAGQEGELIQRWVQQKANCKKPMKRLWISSLTDESIKEGFESLKPQTDFDRLYMAGLSRAIGDWILGMNATRLFTLKYSQGRNILSIGRVQTPTLALVVARQKEIDNFVPEDFWELKTNYRDVTFLYKRSLLYRGGCTRRGRGDKGRFVCCQVVHYEARQRVVAKTFRPDVASGGMQQKIWLFCRPNTEVDTVALREKVHNLSACRHHIS